MSVAGRLATALADPAPTGLFEGDLIEEVAEHGIGAAVLIAVTDRPEPGVILTVRRADMRTHAGQVAFPGGRIDEGEDAVRAALREAEEELMLDRAAVDVVGAIEPYRTVTGFHVTPIIGVVPPDLPLEPHEREVADWFEAPLTFLLDPANHRRERALFRGRERHYYEIMWEGRQIWGATAAIIVNLSRRVDWR